MAHPWSLSDPFLIHDWKLPVLDDRSNRSSSLVSLSAKSPRSTNLRLERVDRERSESSAIYRGGFRRHGSHRSASSHLQTAPNGMSRAPRRQLSPTDASSFAPAPRASSAIARAHTNDTQKVGGAGARMRVLLLMTMTAG